MKTLLLGNINLSCFVNKNNVTIGNGNKNSIIGQYSKNVILENNNYSVISINSFAFMSANFSTIQLPDSINFIGHGAFNDCRKLKSINLSNTKVTKMCYEVFRYCKKLKLITNPSTITSYESYCFSGTAITEITLGESARNVAGNFIAQCYKLKKIISAHSNFFFRDGVLYNPPGTTIICILPLLKQFDYFDVDYFGFGCCEGSYIETVVIKSTVMRIDGDSFADCSYLKSITFENGIGAIGSCILRNACLAEIYFPASVSGLYPSAFFGSNLVHIDLSKTSLYIIPQRCFSCCKYLSLLELPHSLKQIQSYAFENSIKLIEINFPRSINKLNPFAFEGSALEFVNLSFTKIKVIGKNDLTSTNLKKISLPIGLVRLDNEALVSEKVIIEYYGNRSFSGKCHIVANVLVGKDYPGELFCKNSVSRGVFIPEFSYFDTS